MAHEMPIPQGQVHAFGHWLLWQQAIIHHYGTIHYTYSHCIISNPLSMATSTTMIDSMLALYSTHSVDPYFNVALLRRMHGLVSLPLKMAQQCPPYM